MLNEGGSRSAAHFASGMRNEDTTATASFASTVVLVP